MPILPCIQLEVCFVITHFLNAVAKKSSDSLFGPGEILIHDI